MYSFVRPSKFRHVYGTGSKKDLWYENLRFSTNAWDTNYVVANPEYLAVNWNAGGGGAFAVIPLETVGKLSANLPLFTGHSGQVLDTDFSPFNDELIISGAEDARVMIWKVPEGYKEDVAKLREGGEMENIKPLAQLKGHGKRVGHVKFNPVAENVAASSGLDYSVRLWDIEHQGEKGAVGGFQDTIQSLDWNYNGTLVAASSRDKKLRLVDLRAKQVVGTAPSHQGGKGSRVVWLGSTGKLATTGFGRTSGRELFVWDVANLEKPELTIEIDTSSGILMPFYDESSKMLYLAGKGDGNIRYYEYEKSKMFYINEYTSTDPQRGMAAMPKRGVNVRDIELMRLFKAVNSNSIEPISFKAPRKDESFQADLYPPAPGGLAALSSEQYFSGSTADPVLVDFESIYTNGIAKLVPAEPTPVVSSETTPSSPPPSRASAPPPPLSPLASPHPESPVLSPTSAVESPHTISEPPSPTAGKSREIAEAPATANVYPPLEAVDTFLLDAKIEKVVSGYQELINQHSEALSKKIDSLTETQLALETKISELESSNTQLLSKISSYEQEIDSLKQLTDSLQTKSADLEDSFKAHDSRVSELESNLVTTIAAAAKLTSAVENFSP